MNLRYRLIQFVADTYREEGRNVALVVYANEKTYVRALGVDERGYVDTAWFERLLAETQKESAWVYQEWANWWRELVGDGVGNVEVVDAALERLNAKSISMSTTEGGVIEIPDEEDPKNAVEWLYRRLIGDEDVFFRHLDEAIFTSELEHRGSFSRNAIVRLDLPTGEQGLAMDAHFSYLVEPSLRDQLPRAAFKILRFRGVTQENLLKAINDAVYTFETAVRCGYLDPSRCVVLADAPEPGQEALHGRLAAVAHVIDITADDAGIRIWRILSRHEPT